MRRRFLFLSFVCTWGATVSAQDSTRTLSSQQVLEIVKRYHPVARQAEILVEKAKADVTIARGLFDPMLYNQQVQKTFDGSDYYRYNRPELIVPTWFGIDLIAGIENVQGARIDPQETAGRSNYIGISMPLAKNLLMDKRRAALQTARIFRQASRSDQRQLLNDLLLDAMKTYWNWMQQYQMARVLDEAVAVNEKRLDLVRNAFRLGDRPAIDTTEALTQLQNFELLRNQAWLAFQNAGLELSAFLWTSGDTPASLPPDAIPADDAALVDIPSAPLPLVQEFLDAAMRAHPELQLYDFKLDALAIDRKLKFQELLPTMNFRYNQLGKGYDVLRSVTAGPLFENNYRYGLSMGLPLRLSQGRGEYRKAKLRITETRLDRNLKQVQINNNVRMYFNEVAVLKKQVGLQEKAWTNYRTLLRGEEIRFQTGESSLFLINARETRALEALQKLQELRTKYYMSVYALQWAAGMLAP